MDDWSVIRRGRTVRVDAHPNALRDGEEDAIVLAVEAEAADDDFESVRVTGAVLDEPSRGTSSLIRRIGDVANRHGKRLDVGPI